MTPARTPTVLVIEDDTDDQILLAEALQSSGREALLEFCADGEAATAYLHRVLDGDAPTPHMVLLDLRLPGESGLELLARLKSHPVLRALPIVVFTTSWFEDDVRAAYAAGANAFVIKPLRFEELVATMQSLTAFWLDRCQPSPLPARGVGA